jgi:hypothetical protein
LGGELVDDDDVEHDHDQRPDRKRGDDRDVRDRVDRRGGDGGPSCPAANREQTDDTATIAMPMIMSTQPTW